MNPTRTLMTSIGGGLLAVVVALALTACGSSDDRYLVRAIFDNAVNVIPGEDVKIAGVKVGTIDALHVVDNKHAAVILNIETPGFQDFRADASCTIQAQSLIGEKFVACTPTQVRRTAKPPPPAPVIPEGKPGAGQRLVPLRNTSSPVDPDLINNIMRQPGPQRFTVILNELGIALGARGEDLREAVRRADPALAQTDKVLAILASQNETLTQLAQDSDAALAPLARERRHLTGAIRSSGAVAQATARQREAMAENLRRFPAFLRELIPTTDRLGALADAGTPLMASLDHAAPGLNTFASSLKPFAEALGPWFDSLGETANAGTTAVVEGKPAIDALTALAKNSAPTLTKLGSFLGNLRYAGGIENFLDLIYNTANATNSFDSISHNLRGTLIVTPCATYAITPSGACNANFVDLGDSAAARAAGNDAAAAGGAPRDAGLQRAAFVLNGGTPAEALRKYPDPDTGAATTTAGPTAKRSAAPKAGTRSTTGEDSAGALLDYLLAP